MKKMISKISDWWHARRLVSKHAIIVLASGLTIIPLTVAGIVISTYQALLQIEQEEVADQVARARNSIKVFENGLNKSLGDYAYWDDSYNYMRSPGKAFEESTLGPFTMQNMGINVITYVRFDGKAIYARAVDTKAVKEIAPESALMQRLTSAGDFFYHAKKNQNHLAYIRTDRGVYVLYSQWVNNSAGTATPIGFLVMGNLLSEEDLSAALQSDVHLNLNIAPALAAQMEGKERPATSAIRENSVASSIGLTSEHGHVLATIDFETPRHLMSAAKEALVYLLAGLALGTLFIAGLLVWGIRAISVIRLQRLEAFVRNYGQNPVLDPRVSRGEDEIATLAQTFQKMSEELASAEEELRQTSYLQGKADSAAGMLHNVRNALAPIRVMQEKWLREETLPFRQNMGRAADELASDSIEPKRKAELEAFLLSAARKIALGSAGRLTEMEEAKVSVDQISAILGGYNFNTSGQTSGDDMDFLRLLKQEIKNVDGRPGTNITFDLPEAMPLLSGNPLHLSQVVGNILVNADEAMIAAGADPKRITVTWQQLDADLIEIRLKDNGDGISPENLPKTFKREYSTRSHKAGGIGLHWSGNAMRAMGGSIALESEGPGCGATAVLTIRCAKEVNVKIAA